MSSILLKIMGFFCGWGTVFDYACKMVNNLLCKPDIANRIDQAVKLCEEFVSLADFLARKDWMPTEWRPYFVAVYTSVETIAATFKDGKVTPDEIEKAINQFKIAYATWLSED